MMVYPFDPQEQAPLAPTQGDSLGDFGNAFAPFGSGLTALGGSGPSGMSNDLVSRFLPPAFSSAGAGNSSSGIFSGGLQLLTSLFTQIGSLISQLFGGGSSGSGGGLPGGSPEQFYAQANGGSVGDPHLSFNGQTWNDMGSQSDLLDSASFGSGFQISTQASTPNQNGVTYNQSATISTNFGLNSVSMNNAGNVAILQNGEQVSLAKGQTLDMGNGETVTQNQDGSLQVLADDGMGGTMNTTLHANGNGVDVTTNAQNVDLGGALANGPNAQPSPTPQPPGIFPPFGMPPGTIPPYGLPTNTPPSPIGPYPEPIRMNDDPAFDSRRGTPSIP